MSRDQLNSGSFDERRRPDLAGLDPDQIEAARLSEILAAEERSEVPDLDPIEDPMLASLSATATSLRSSLEVASAGDSFSVFHRRSRGHVLAATPHVRVVTSASAKPESLLQRWNGLFTSVSAAAAAAVATFVVTVLAIGGGTSPATVTNVADPADEPPQSVSAEPETSGSDSSAINLTTLSVDEQLTRYVDLLKRLDALNVAGQPADEQLLRDITDTSSVVARTLDEEPDAVSGGAAWVAYRATFDGQKSLSKASVASDEDQQVLDTAQVAAEGAFVTAARYLGNPAQTPTYEEVVATVGDPNEQTLTPEEAP